MIRRTLGVLALGALVLASTVPGIAQQTREQIGSPKGIARLSDDMRDRLNAYLGGDDDEVAVKSVAIQDLLVKPQ